MVTTLQEKNTELNIDIHDEERTARQMLKETTAGSKTPINILLNFELRHEYIKQSFDKTEQRILAGLSNNSKYAPVLVFQCIAVAFQEK